MTSINIKKAEELYGAKYIGFYDIPAKTRDGKDTLREHIEVFYQPNPDTSKGHTHYFGLLVHPLTEQIYITNAASILEAKYPAYQFADGSYITTRYRHDYVVKDGVMLDGGLDYVRYNPQYPPNGHAVIVGDHEEFVPYS